MKYIRIFFITGSVQEQPANSDFNKTNSVITNLDDDDDDDDDDDIDEIDIDEEEDVEVEPDETDVDDVDLDEDDLDDDDDEEEDDDDEDVVSESGDSTKSSFDEALQQWSNDNARDIAEDDSTPLRSNL